MGGKQTGQSEEPGKSGGPSAAGTGAHDLICVSRDPAVLKRGKQDEETPRKSPKFGETHHQLTEPRSSSKPVSLKKTTQTAENRS